MSTFPLKLFLHGLSYKTGLCSRFMKVSDELIVEAKRVRAELEQFQADPNPLAALAATAHNNQEFERGMAHDAAIARNLKRAIG